MPAKLPERTLTYVGTIRGPFRTVVEVIVKEGENARTLPGRRAIVRRYLAEHPEDKGKTLDLMDWRYSPEIERKLARQRLEHEATTALKNEAAIANSVSLASGVRVNRRPVTKPDAMSVAGKGSAPTFRIELAYEPATPRVPLKPARKKTDSAGRVCWRQA